MGIRYIGNKQRVLPRIMERVRAASGGRPATVADLFSGTATVTRGCKEQGHRVVANDLLASGEAFATAALLISEVPSFSRLLAERAIPPPAGRLVADPLDRVLSHLEGLEGEDGFFWRTYAPAGSAAGGTRRQYFTDQNARRIDAIRAAIGGWWADGLLAPEERALLLCSLMLGANAVANVAGTYGFFLATWYDRALDPLRLPRPPITPGRTDHTVRREDANALASTLEADIAYVDPPYTKRQYSAYYHILETLALGDEPEVWGLTGLRPREGDSWASAYCYKRRAPDALRELVGRLRCRHILLSYSSDGHIAHEEILAILGTRGPVEWWPIPLARYRSNGGGEGRDDLVERLYGVRCAR